MSHSDNSRRGKFYRGEAEHFLCKHYNRVDRRRARDEIRDAAGFIEDETGEDLDPLNYRHRHGGLWAAS